MPGRPFAQWKMPKMGSSGVPSAYTAFEVNIASRGGSAKGNGAGGERAARSGEEGNGEAHGETFGGAAKRKLSCVTSATMSSRKRKPEPSKRAWIAESAGPSSGSSRRPIECR